MLIVNVGSGAKTSKSPDVVSVDWSPYLRIRSNPFLFRLAPLFLNRARLDMLRALPERVIARDVRQGLPFSDASADAVYHSHFLSHLDRSIVPGFFAEVRRVLRPGGIHRIVVFDMERVCSDYLAHLRKCENDPSATEAHDGCVAEVIELMVRKEAFGSSQQKPLRRFVENLLLGDARQRGETCQWMYDRINLPYLLKEAGFASVSTKSFTASGIADWSKYGLDQNDSGGEYKPDSLYVEAVK